MNEIKKGFLFIVSTPIGNLKDITKRAVECLSSVDIIACEDTRHTGMLLSHLGIKKKLISYNNFNENTKSSFLLSLLENGNNIAVVSDAGTPGISDPAYRIVKLAVDSGFGVFSIPGPSALLSALVVSGFPIDRFVFEGFFPPRGAKRLKHIENLKNESRTIVLFESPHRILNLLELLLEIFGDRDVSVSREMTKIYEETIRGKLSFVIESIKKTKPRGEYTVVVRGL
jgi:16S rRNA (cytidine1402-2'-O)-methyltransferase